MDRNYDRSLKEVLLSEGGYTNEATDPGGPTNFGITIYDARMYLNASLSSKPPWTHDDLIFMHDMKLEQAKRIYRGKYWHMMRCEDLPDGVDYSVFDFGVNSGVMRSAKYLQALVGTDQDGYIGDKTLAATRAYKDKIQLITEFNDRRLAYLRRLPIWPTYKKGWTTRVIKVKALSLNMLGTVA